MISSTAKFKDLNFGTKPTTDTYDTIYVSINPDMILSDFAQAYYYEMQRRNAPKFDSFVSNGRLTVEKLDNYFKSIIMIRIQAVQGHCPVWRQAKRILIPTWIQFVISLLGEYVDINKGFKIVPTFDYDYNIEELIEFSSVIKSFSEDGLTMHEDAFPRDVEGDADTMSMVVIDGYVKSMTETAAPIMSYVNAFLGAKLEEEAAFKILYRVRYDDVRFIRDMLLHEEAIY